MAPPVRDGQDNLQPNSYGNGHARNVFEAPPSTMAVQLINNLASSNNKPSQQPQLDDLKRLMAEISETESSPNLRTDVKVKLEHKHKLIYVFARAVLDRLLSDDPFNNIAQLVSQSSEALEIFISAIREVPAVLEFVLPNGQVLQNRDKEPLWLWLFPKVLAILGRPGCEGLTDKIREFFCICFHMVARSPKLWHLNSNFFMYLKECITVLLSHLQNPGIIPHGTMGAVKLPSNEGEFFSVFTHKVPLLDAGLEYTYTIRETPDAVRHLDILLSMLVEILTEAWILYDATPAFEDYMAWLSDTLLVIHEMQKRLRSTPKLLETCEDGSVLLLRAMQCLLSSLDNSHPDAMRRKGSMTLAILLADLLDMPNQRLNEPTLLSICRSILTLSVACQHYNSVHRFVLVHLLPAIRRILGDKETLGGFGNDFQKAAVTLCNAFNVELLRLPELITSESYDSIELNAEFLNLDIDRGNDIASNNEPPPKRRKLEKSEDSFDKVTSSLFLILGGQAATGLSGLSQNAASYFSALGENDRCKAISILSRIPCAVMGTLVILGDLDGDFSRSRCSVCEENKRSDANDSSRLKYQESSAEAIATFEALVTTPAFQNSRRCRVMVMFALRRFALHFPNADLLDLEVSNLGQWCLKSLRSSVRELRIAAGRTMIQFLSYSDASQDITRRNRFNVLELLRDYSEGANIHIQETMVLAWGQVGRISNDEELNIVLLRLVAYLGHPNPVTSGVAFKEILQLCKTSNVTVERMFSPYWNTIAIETVKDIFVRPQTTQLMADLLGVSVTEFLLLTQTFTLPWLVLLGKSDVIKRISEARKDKEGWLACMETSNMVAILAFLLAQRSDDVENFVMSRFKAVSSQFKQIEFSDLMRVEPASQVFHLLKAAGEADDAKKARIHGALQILAQHTNTGPEHSRASTDAVGRFLEQHILGLVARLSEVINDSRDTHAGKEKDRCVKAFAELVRAAKAHTRVARPQICACLQSALANIKLQSSAFSAWDTLLRNLDDEDVAAMLESTFSIVIEHWDTFDQDIKNVAIMTLQYLIDERGRLIRNTIVNLPSLGQFSQLSEIEGQINKWRQGTDIGNGFQIYSRRIAHENSGVVLQALVELKEYLCLNQDFLQSSAISEQPDPVVGGLVRSILDISVRFSGSHTEISILSAECIGLIGCLDSNRVESVREQREMVVVSNFEDAGETTDFVLFILEEVIVKAFLSATDTVWQGFLSYVMQELLWKCDFKEICAPIIASGKKNYDNPIWQKWCTLPIGVRNTLTPFLTSKYLMLERDLPKYTYPIFSPENMLSDKIYNVWLRAFVLDLLQKSLNVHASVIFPPLCRAIRIKDISIASFLLPYVALHTILLGSDEHRREIGEELLRVLSYEPETNLKVRREELKLCTEAVFRVLDYLSRWAQAKTSQSGRSSNLPAEALIQLQHVQSVVDMIPSEIVSQRAIECKSYSRALFYWEQHIRKTRNSEKSPTSDAPLLERLQDIYTQIDEPDGIEGISAHLHVLDIEQQILGHRKAGRWTAAQSWYEIKLAEVPDDLDVQVNLLTCLKESGQHDVLLNYVEGMRTATDTAFRLLPFATEASWSTGRWKALSKYTAMAPKEMSEDFNIRIGQTLLALHAGDTQLFKDTIDHTRKQIASTLSAANTASLGACHDTMLKLHVLTELEMIGDTGRSAQLERPKVLASLSRRLEALGAYLNDKQYLLGIRRAAMQLSSSYFTEGDVASAWLTSARLARKGKNTHQSFNAVLHASQLKDDSATIEHARLLWQEGHHRKAIQNLQTAIENNTFISHNRAVGMTYTGVDASDQQNFLTARAHLLLAKWLDSAGQTHSQKLRSQYQLAAKTHSKWEKGHYYLGRHYNKLLDTEKNLPREKQSEKYLIGETAKLVIDNYLRSLTYGTKYLYQTLPRILTLWLDLGTQATQPVDNRPGSTKDFVPRITEARKTNLKNIHIRFNKHIQRLPAYIFYTALPQIVARIAHPNADVYTYLVKIIYKVVAAHPQQALWSLLAVCASTQVDRKNRGIAILQSLQSDSSKKSDKSDPSQVDIRSMIKSGQRLADQLLLACNAGDFTGNRTTTCSLSRDLGFNQKTCTPNPLAVPAERVLTATLPTLTTNIIGHKAFSRDIVTISSFSDRVLVLSSLQKPRKLVAYGSDGEEYGLMCKPKDDLRKDQRLMEFNSMINRALKRDAEASKRQLYIKTYAVTPLNEECGLIEWVEGLKTLRDILLGLYKSQGISVNYRDIEACCDQVKEEAPETLPWFTKKVLGQFPAIFHLWFVQQFPEPSTWFAARIRYTRSCAVMSMVGTMLGLGDRHGENILFEEGNGGIFHVDFNCLFEKGLTFAKPERVPFRLTHNMVDAMGMYGYEGPFRKSSELTLTLLRQHQETLMTILEAFIYDPTLDLLKKTEKKRKEGSIVIAQTPQLVLDAIQRKVKGLLPGESVPLGVEGQVDELIQQATNQFYLAGMYIGWCSFL